MTFLSNQNIMVNNWALCTEEEEQTENAQGGTPQGSIFFDMNEHRTLCVCFIQLLGLSDTAAADEQNTVMLTLHCTRSQTDATLAQSMVSAIITSVNDPIKVEGVQM